MKYLIIVIALLFSSPMLMGQSGPCSVTGDRDMDGLCDDIDPCPDTFNPNPVDEDKDGVFDACDNSPLFNPDQKDIDGDGIGDVSDPCIDPDGDGVCGAQDKCPGKDDKIDVDFDGVPDGCDSCIDSDRDNICDSEDDCIDGGRSCNDQDPCTTNDIYDDDCNCKGTLLDEDNDGVCDLEDQCPGFDDSIDGDGDGIPDACDDTSLCTTCTPDHNDRVRICHIADSGKALNIYGRCEELERYFNNFGSFKNESDHCGPCNCEDKGDVDTDGDGVCDGNDFCPDDPTITKDNGCGCDDQDSDGDGVCDSIDLCPGHDDAADSDDDGVPDACDDLDYCAPGYDPTMEWISSVAIDGRSLGVLQSANLKMHSEVMQLEKGVSHELEIKSEYIDDVCTLSSQVWIDWDGDGSFEEDEVALEARSLDAVSVALNIDDNELGTYRARAMVHYGRINSACQEGIQGEVEDFLIEVIEAQSCPAVIEDFIYEVEEEFEGINGGAGWSSAWEVVREDENSQLSIIEGSIIGEAGNKLGVLNAGPTNVTMSRSIGQGLTGSTDMRFRLNLYHVSGSGTVDFYINNVAFGVNAVGNVYLGDVVSEEMAQCDTLAFLGKVVFNHDGEDEIYLWTIYESYTPDVEDALQYKAELGSRLDYIKISLTSTDSFVPFVNFIDGIKIGCDENFRSNKASLSADSRIEDHEAVTKEGALEFSVYPNPAFIDQLVIRVVGEKPVYLYSLHDANGKLIKTGEFLGGLNRLPREGIKGGLYYLTIHDDGKKHQEKIVIVT